MPRSGPRLLLRVHAVWSRKLLIATRGRDMNKGQRQIIAEKIGSTVRVLELLGFDYTVTPPRIERRKGNKSPRVVEVQRGGRPYLWVYNSAGGDTWANKTDGTPIATVGSVEDLYDFL